MTVDVSELTIINRCENFDKGLIEQLDHRRSDHKTTDKEHPSPGVVILRYKDSHMPIDLVQLKSSFLRTPSRRRIRSHRPRKVLRSGFQGARHSTSKETQVFTKFLWKMYYGMIVPLRLRLASL